MPCVRRSPKSPILTRRDIPAVAPHVADVSSVFNPGAVAIGGWVHLLLRVQTRGRETVLMPAESGDGETFTVRPHLVEIDGLRSVGERIYHVYDPRLTVVDGSLCVVFAADVDGACRLGVARAADARRLDRFDLVSFGPEDARNGVLFPEKVGGRYLRLERPNRTRLAGGVASGDEIVLRASDDLVRWERVGPVMRGRPHYWDELIGSGPPPIKTPQGWLHVYHGIATHFAAANIYQAGVCLLDLRDPTRVLARGRNNILEPREPWELAGQVPNVVFPSGMVVEGADDAGFARPESLVRLYYGAADTVIGLATATVGELLEACGE
jgi:beta-1,4-mannooligosaccharide/beta-1,4-mannosyl-N-acetylglucosamine phosphorylase